jgi:Zn-dependent protease/CBS domain-containing protein
MRVTSMINHMRWSFHLARIAGIEVRIHFTFLLLLGFVALSLYHAEGSIPAALVAMLFICLIFFCVLLHEFGHAFAARRYGINTPDITLLPIGGVARLERMPEKPSEELVVAVAGPLVNVVIAALLLPFIPHQHLWSLFPRGDVGLLTALFFTNKTLVLFNLIPAFPMDGGRVLRALLAMRMDYARATNIAASLGQAIAVGGGLWALIHGPQTLVLVAIFVYFGAQSEASIAQMKSLSNGLRVSSAMLTQFTALPRSATLHDAVEAVLASAQHDFPIVESTGTVCGVLTRDDLIVALRESGAETPVASVMRTDVPSIHHMMHFDRAFAIMQECGSSALPVVDSTGKLVGLFTPENVGQLMMFQSALAAQSARRPSPPPLPVIQGR